MDKEKPTPIVIKEYKNGKFQVWKENEVLRPCTLEWEGAYQAKHQFMYYRSLKAARKAVTGVQRKEAGEQEIKTHYLYC